MATITKIHFTISANGSPMAILWIDDMDTTKDFEAIRIALKPQVAYLMFCGVGSEIEIKKGNKGFWNVTIPDVFTNLIDNYKVSENGMVKAVGAMLDNGINNMINSLDIAKNGDTTKVCVEEAKHICHDFLKDTATFMDFAVDELKNSKNKFLKSIGKLAEKEDLTASEVKEVNEILLKHADRLARCMEKNNMTIEEQADVK